eukprot:CAMPEP_0116913866 /NCGR_PEP_ID=MMETSP0467-20121206/16962_1 /TAXON_ID=283647 /ORGANISM="Mesodinium pulex, Strain SPMC105" /LENGTH=91 /DNA_ID=CAMNT_0004590169 /DNA_START=1552 /DNA_END=1827 /DNA_ORIENTATION=-
MRIPCCLNKFLFVSLQGKSHDKEVNPAEKKSAPIGNSGLNTGIGIGGTGIGGLNSGNGIGTGTNNMQGIGIGQNMQNQQFNGGMQPQQQGN